MLVFVVIAVPGALAFGAILQGPSTRTWCALALEFPSLVPWVGSCPSHFGRMLLRQLMSFCTVARPLVLRLWLWSAGPSTNTCAQQQVDQSFNCPNDLLQLLSDPVTFSPSPAIKFVLRPVPWPHV